MMTILNKYFIKRALLWLLLLFFTTANAANVVKTVRFATEATYPPFEYTDASGQIKGFDIDIANALCQQMKVECTFSNQSFNSLIPSLKLAKYDALIASIGVTPERKKQVDFTNSYYQPSASFVGLIAKNYSLKHLDGLIVGVQQGTTFENYLHDKFDGRISIKAYGSVQDAFLDLDAGRVDVVIADTPIAQAWLKQKYTQFNIIDRSITDVQYFGAGYGIAVSKNNPELLKLFNNALAEIKKNGTYARIIHQYFGVNNFAKTESINGFLMQILLGTLVTLKVAFCAAGIGIMIGIAGALLESIPIAWLRYLAAGIIFITRGLPELLVLFFIYFGLTALFKNWFHQYIDISPFTAGVAALSLIFGSYASQVFRGAFLAIDRGQIEAGKALGLNARQILYFIKIPQAWRHAIPGLGNLWLVLLKDTAIVTLIGLTDMMNAAKMAASTTHQPFTFYLIAAVIYLLITTISQRVINYFTLKTNRYIH